MQPRMKNPGAMFPAAMEAIQALNGASEVPGLSATTRRMVHLRASQINGCSVCVDSAFRYATKAGDEPDKLFAVAAWRDTPYFSEAERAALALTEAATRLADRPDPVPDQVWEEAAKHYDEETLGALVLWIATVNLFNRLNAPTKQIAGAWTG